MELQPIPIAKPVVHNRFAEFSDANGKITARSTSLINRLLVPASHVGCRSYYLKWDVV